MDTLYPDTTPYKTHRLAVDSRHTLYVEECGTPDGIPALFLHGGPGAGCEPYHRRFFDPERYRAVLFDQRGAGQSTPHAELIDNTTADLIKDIEQLREHFGIERWLVFGGSWGSTLALAYAEQYPQRVSALVLRGVFLCRPHELKWFYQQGASRIFPDYWQDFLAPIATNRHADLMAAYHEVLTGDDEVAQLAAAKAWSIWEGRTATLLPNPDVVEHFGGAHVALSMARIECHYFKHNAFLTPNQLLADASLLNDIPGVIVHGRYDLICPLENAWQLHREWRASELQIIADAGHSAAEINTTAALVAALDRFAVELAGPHISPM